MSTSTITLSALMERGLAKTRPSKPGWSIGTEKNPRDTSAVCPLMAAAVGLMGTLPDADDTLVTVFDLFKRRKLASLLKQRVPLPHQDGDGEVGCVIIHLYDALEWSREDILAWLKQQGL